MSNDKKKDRELSLAKVLTPFKLVTNKKGALNAKKSVNVKKAPLKMKLSPKFIQKFKSH